MKKTESTPAAKACKLSSKTLTKHEALLEQQKKWVIKALNCRKSVHTPQVFNDRTDHNRLGSSKSHVSL